MFYNYIQNHSTRNKEGAVKRFVLMTVAFFLLLPCLCQAQQYTITSWTRTQYLGANGGIFLDAPVIQSDLNIAWDNGLYTNLWWSVGLDDSDFNSNFGDEVDWSIGWTGQRGPWRYNIGLMYLEVVDLTASYNDFISVYGDASYTLTQHLSLYGRYEGYWKVSQAEVSEGDFSFLGARYLIPLSSRLSLAGRAAIEYDNNSFSGTEGFLWSGETTLMWSAASDLSILVGAKYTDQITTDDNRKAEFVPGVGISYTF